MITPNLPKYGTVLTLLGVGWLTSAAMGQPVDSTELVAHFPLDGNGQDIGPNQHHGTVTGAVPTSDRFGNADKAMWFDANDDLIDCGDHPAFRFAGSFTISAWVKSDGQRRDGYIVSKYELHPTPAPYSYGLGDALDTVPYGFISDGSSYADAWAAVATMKDGRWHQVALVYDGASIKLYMDGMLAAERSPAHSANSFDNGLPLTIGNLADSSLGWGGAIDDVRLYSRALTATELENAFTSDLEPGIGPGGLHSMDVSAADLLWEPVSARLFASIRSQSSSYGNHLLAFDADTLSPTDCGELGLQPGRLAAASSGLIYAAVNGAQAIRSFNPGTGSMGASFSVAPATSIDDLVVSPRSQTRLVVVKTLPGGGQRAVLYDSGLARPGVLNYAFFKSQFSPDGNYLYWRRAGTRDFFRANVDDNGLSNPKLVFRGLDGADFSQMGDREYFETREVFNLVDRSRVTPFPAGGSRPSFSLRQDLDRIAYLSKGSGSWNLEVFQALSYQAVTGGPIPGVDDSAANLELMTPNLAAFSTATQIHFVDMPTAFAPRDLVVESLIDVVPVTGTPTALQPFRYSFTVRNTGNTIARNVVLVHALPTGSAVKLATFAGATVTPESGGFIQQIAKLLPNEQATLMVDLIPNVAGTLTLTASARADGVEATPLNNTASLLTEVQAPAEISVHATQVVEAWPTNAIYMSLSKPVGGLVLVTYEVLAGTALYPGDFTTTSYATFISPGARLRRSQLAFVNDTLPEPAEYLTVRITSVEGAVVDEEFNTVQILDDDAPLLEILDASAFEGETLRFLVRQSPASPNAVSVRYFLAAETASGGDYSGQTGVLNFQAGEKLAEIEVPAVLDGESESDETFRIVLFSPSGANLLRSEAIGTIKNRVP